MRDKILKKLNLGLHKKMEEKSNLLHYTVQKPSLPANCRPTSQNSAIIKFYPTKPRNSM